MGGEKGERRARRGGKYLLGVMPAFSNSRAWLMLAGKPSRTQPLATQSAWFNLALSMGAVILSLSIVFGESQFLLFPPLFLSLFCFCFVFLFFVCVVLPSNRTKRD